MHKNATYSFMGFQFAFVQLTFVMLAFCLIVDSINGFFLSGMGIDPQLSAAYKLLLLAVVLYQIGCFSLKTLAFLLVLLLVLMIGPLVNLSRSLDALGLIEDFTSALKLITPVIVFCYVVLVALKCPETVLRYGKRVCLISFLILFANLILGLLGFGFASYGNSEIGVKGFFFAGNEVSGLFIVFFGYVLHQLWQKKKLGRYLLFSTVSMACGVMIATKAAMLASVVMIVFIPIVNDRNKLLNLTWLKLKLISPIVLLVILGFFFLIPILESTGIWGRLVWFYEKKGLVGLLFSGRDRFIATAIDVYYNTATYFDMAFGLGRSGLGMLTKDSMEVDPVDMFFWFGLTGLGLYILIVTVFLRTSYLAARLEKSTIAPFILLVNILLIVVSIVAGHIYTSGMLGPFIGLINGLAVADIIVERFKSKELLRKTYM